MIVLQSLNLTTMKILHVITTMSPRIGGPSAVLKSLAHEQAHAGHEVTVCSTSQDYPTGQMDVRTGSPVLNDNFSIWYHKSQFTPLSFSISLGSWLKRSITTFDIVHIHGIYRFPTTYGAWCARRAGVPYIIMPHGSLDPFLFRQSRFGKMALPLKRMYECLFDMPNLNHASAIHYTAQEEAERAAFLELRARAVVIPNGVDWEFYANLPGWGSFRRRIGLEERRPLVLFLGRINFKKGLDLLVPSFVHVLEMVPEAWLAFVGPDNEGYGTKVRQWCREQGIADNVSFVDHLGPEEVKQAYVDADLFVLPSYTENFGMTVVEAMACGCPVVISDKVNIWREIQKEGAGLVFGLHPQEIANAICQVLLDKDIAREMGRRGRVAAQRHYSWPRIVDQMVQVYRKVIEEAAAKRRLGT